MSCARQVFKTTSYVLNFDVNIANIALIAFCSLAVTKLANWPMSSLLSCGSLANSLLQLSLALIEFSLERFPVSLITLCPLALSRFVTLAEFGTLAEFDAVAEYYFASLADS